MAVGKDLDEYIQKRRQLYGYRIKTKPKKLINVNVIVENFNKNMGQFLERLRGLMSHKKEVVKLNTIGDLEQVDLSNQKSNSELDDEYVNVDETENESEQRKPFEFIEKIIAFFNKKGSVVEEEYVEEVIELDYEEVRQAFRIANSLIKKLPTPVLKAFKESDDYGRYYNVMKKIGLVKQKDE